MNLDFDHDHYVMTIDLDLTSNRQKKLFRHNPQAFLVKKVSSAEVQYGRLSPDDQELFKRAKNAEVSSFIKSEAVRRCLSWEEQQRAQNSDRVLRARWARRPSTPREVTRRLKLESWFWDTSTRIWRTPPSSRAHQCSRISCGTSPCVWWHNGVGF